MTISTMDLRWIRVVFVKYRTILARARGVASKSDISGSFPVYYDIQDD